ncbi:MAG: molybdopterin oxidoreductase family protein, partial [Bdellovibrionia bacterium]
MSRSTALKSGAHTESAENVKQTRDSISDIWGERMPYYGENAWPVRVDERVTAEPDRWVQSACVLCSNGCACDIAVKDNKIVGVRGRAADRVNRGRLGPKGLHGWIANESPDRLKHPLIRQPDGKFREASWDEAMELIVSRTKKILSELGPAAIGLYDTGQLFIEEYYTLSVMAHAGLGTRNMDGNTRLCTSTASIALKETFGSDGQPGSYSDFDVTDCIFLVGHNMSNTQTVLWSKILDRKQGPKPPKLIVVDPRRTETAKAADIHLAPKLGTNVALLNGLIHLMIQNGHLDQAFIDQHTVGFDELRNITWDYHPERVEEITGVPVAQLRAAAELLGTTPSLVSTALQGVYQSNQASAAAVQINNIHLIRGLIGKPGSGVLQMNGQPTAQNTRETGCDGEFPAFFNYENPEHMKRLAEHWNVDPMVIPHWTEPTHAMEMMRMAELGALRMFWVICTNPAVSLPELHRVRKIFKKPSLFLIVQDAFMTETAQLADVVLPAAIWAEKTGTFTNADRTVHISHKAIHPPGEARSDLDIFLDYCQRMNFRDKDGNPLIKWSDPEGAFNHFKELTRGQVCDYSGMTYEKLSKGSGIQWPCNEMYPEGAPRLYTDFNFPTSPEVCQTWGHDLETGGAHTAEEYKANNPQGRALIKAAHYQAPIEEPDSSYPFYLTTGRVVYHFHTRTKTGRSSELYQASPDAFAEISRQDAEALGIQDGDMLTLSSRRSSIDVKAKIGEIAPGHVFVPFHFGYWDEDEKRHRAANELTINGWDPVSKQPFFKFAAVQVRKADSASPGEKIAHLASALKEGFKKTTDKVVSKAHQHRSRVPDYLGLLI